MLLSSRLSGGVEHRSGWLGAFQSIVRQLQCSGRVVLTCDRTTCDRYLTAVSETRSLNLVRVVLPAQVNVADWMRQQSPLVSTSGTSQRKGMGLRVSPSMGTVRDSHGEGRDLIPLADRILCSLADDVYVLYARAGGGIARLVSTGLRFDAFRGKRLYLAQGHDRIPASLLERWVRQGGIYWSVLPGRSNFSARPTCTVDLPLVSPIVPLPTSTDRYLFHWTRRQPGPWPDQTEAQYVESVLFYQPSVCRSALSSLQRIVSTQKLLGTSRLSRGDTPVVCFTEQPVEEFLRLRRFRSHQRRWDFELFGIAISRGWLKERGARQVIYGDDACWSTLAESDRPFFQLRQGRGKNSTWYEEAEWRVMGDLYLEQLGPNDAFVFLPNSGAAVRVACVSRWPVVVLRPEGRSLPVDRTSDPTHDTL